MIMDDIDLLRLKILPNLHVTIRMNKNLKFIIPCIHKRQTGFASKTSLPYKLDIV